jgi:hypothetical protein
VQGGAFAADKYAGQVFSGQQYTKPKFFAMSENSGSAIRRAQGFMERPAVSDKKKKAGPNSPPLFSLGEEHCSTSANRKLACHLLLK